METMCTIPFVDPEQGDCLEQVGDQLVNLRTGKAVGRIDGGIPRFVDESDDYAEAFAYQWTKWFTLSDSSTQRSTKFDELIRRTKFDQYPTEGATILECGMGGGDDTQALLRMGFGEVHSFDLSRGVDRAAKLIDDSRLSIFQASIFDIPKPDESYDFVFCHRVLMHTPDPPRALRTICKKVKPGGILFAHSYKRSRKSMRCFKYKVRWLTKRLPKTTVYWYVSKCGPVLQRTNRALHRIGSVGRKMSWQFVPFYHFEQYQNLNDEELRELEQFVTFDALTPQFDLPMTTDEFCQIITESGFDIEHLHDSPVSPVFCTARRVA